MGLLLTRTGQRLSLLMAVAIGSAFSAYAGGPVHGAKASAMGTAFTAVADDPSAMAYNAAGLTQWRGTRFYAGGTAVIPSTTYHNTSGTSEDTKFQTFLPAALYATSDLGTEDLTLGLGLFSPFGIGGRKWDRQGITRYESTSSMIGTLWVNPTIAYRLLPGLSIGAGVDYMLSQNKAQRMVDQSALGASDGRIDLKATGDGWGYNVGLLCKPIAQVGLGLAYRSGVTVGHSGHLRLRGIAPMAQPLFGSAGFDTAIRSDSTYPDILSGGLAYHPAANVTLAFDAEQVRWSSFRSLDLHLKHPVPAAGLIDSSTPLNWKNVWTIKLGAEYRLNERLALRGGYAYVPTPVPAATLNPGNPDSTQHSVSFGFGYQLERLSLDVFYMAGFYQRRTTDNPALRGSYDNFVNYAGASMGYEF